MATKARDTRTLVKEGNKAAAAKADRDKRRAEALVALVERRKARITEDFYDIGEALREILRKELFKALGFDSFNSLLESRRLMSAAQAFKLIKLVDGLPREEALRLGQEKAYAVVAYAAATPEPDMPAELVRLDAKVGGKVLSKASKRDLQQAAREARQRAPKKPLSASARNKRKADRAIETAARSILRGAGIARVEVKLVGDTVVARFARSTVERLASE